MMPASPYLAVPALLCIVIAIPCSAPSLATDPPTEALDIPRATQAVKTALALDQITQFGACYQGTPLLAFLPTFACQHQPCLWPGGPQRGINLDWAAVQTRRASVEACPSPQGAQAHTRCGGRQVTATFAVDLRGSVRGARQSVLEVFRTSGEVDTAEYVLVGCELVEDYAPLLRQLQHMSLHFGVRWRLSQHLRTSASAKRRLLATHSSGKYVVLLQSSVLVAPGWLSTLLAALERRPKAAAVGPLFISGSNEIQPASGFLWSSGVPWSAAWDADARVPLNRLRPMDFVSPACVAVRRETLLAWINVTPAQSWLDIAVSALHRGQQMLYQPAAVVYSSRSSLPPTFTYQDPRRAYSPVSPLWHGFLREEFCSSAHGRRAAMMRQAHASLIWIDDIAPEPDRDSGSVRSAAIMDILIAEGYSLTFQAVVQREPESEARLRAAGVAVLPVLPINEWAWSQQGACPYDLVYVARRNVFQLTLDAIKAQCPAVPIVYDTVDLHFLREAREALTSWKDATIPNTSIDVAMAWLNQGDLLARHVAAHRDVELALIEAANATIVVSADDGNGILKHLPHANLAIVSNIYSAVPVTGICKDRSGILFIGNMAHQPNVQAARWLLTHVMPLVLHRLPESRVHGFMLHIVGAAAGHLEMINHAAIEQYVQFHGHVSADQLHALYSSVQAAVAPLLSGAGVKGKVAEAMLHGVPIVATPVAMEGMFGEHGQNCLIAGNASAFADHIVRLDDDCQLWSTLAAGGLRTVQNHFSTGTAQTSLKRLLHQLGFASLGSRLMCQRLTDAAARNTRDAQQPHR